MQHYVYSRFLFNGAVNSSNQHIRTVVAEEIRSKRSSDGGLSTSFWHKLIKDFQSSASGARVFIGPTSRSNTRLPNIPCDRSILTHFVPSYAFLAPSVTYATAAVGITLTAANRVFLMEPSIDPGVEAQAVIRTHATAC